MTKTANLYARIEPKLKTEAEGILGDLGIPVSNAINIFYRQIVIIALAESHTLDTQSVSRTSTPSATSTEFGMETFSRTCLVRVDLPT